MKQLLLLVIAVVLGVAIAAKMNLVSVGQPEAAQGAMSSVYEHVRDTGVLRCGYVNWKPYYYLQMEDGTNKPTGINVDLMDELAKVTGLKIEWSEEISWGTIGEGFKTNRYDAVCTSMFTDAAKIRNLVLSRPIFYSGPRLFVRGDDARFDNNPDRINQPDVKVAVVDGAASMAWVREHLPRVQIVALPQNVQETEYLMTVTTKKADVLFYDLDEMTGFAKANPGQLRPIEGLPPTNILPHVLAFADPRLRDMMNSALQILIDDGVMEKLRAKYETHYFVPQKSFKE